MNVWLGISEAALYVIVDLSDACGPTSAVNNVTGGECMGCEMDKAAIELLSKCVENIGMPEFAGYLSEFCMHIGKSEIVHLSAFFAESGPQELFASRKDDEYVNLLKMYLRSAYILDPFFDIFQNGAADGVYTIDAEAPDDFRQSEYFRKFYASLNLNDETGILINIAPGAALFFSVGNSAARTSTDNENLRLSLPLIASLARRNWTTLTPDQTDGSGRLSAHLKAAFLSFGSSIMSPRECEIARLIIKGHSTKAIARDLDNSPETIKVHRKRIYAKLDIASQGELMWIFLDSVAKSSPSFDGDPLQNVLINAS